MFITLGKQKVEMGLPQHSMSAQPCAGRKISLLRATMKQPGCSWLLEPALSQSAQTVSCTLDLLGNSSGLCNLSHQLAEPKS